MKKTFVFILIFLFFCSGSLLAQKQFKALLVTTTKGWHHEALHYGVVALQKMASKNEFSLELLQDPKGFNDKNLEQYDVVIFLHTTGDIFDSSQQKSMERFIRSGKGFVGIHSASDTEYDWEWYTKLVGRMFVTHPPTQTAKLEVIDSTFPGVKEFSNRMWTDEFYQFGPEKTTGLHYLLGVDENSYSPAKQGQAKGMGKFHPLAWYHEFDGGRSFYTALGHVPATFDDPDYLQHLFSGIFWAATGRK
jgi:type 1 glutamine amidotransferase